MTQNKASLALQVNNMAASMINLSQDCCETLYHVAHGQYAQGKYLESMETFILLTLAKPKVRKYWYALGASQQMNKHYLKAIKSYEIAAALDPVDPYVHVHAATCYFVLGSREEAFFALECASRAESMSNKDCPGLKEHVELMQNCWKR